MIEFLNYVPVEGSIGELLITKVLPIGALFIALLLTVYVVIREIRKSLEV